MMTRPVMAAQAPPEWVRRYLAVLGADHAAPSVAALAGLTRAHVRAVAFENVTALLRRAAHPVGPVPPPDPDALLGNWEQGRGGGVCFELAPMFGRLLGALGYRASLVLGQISFPGSHQAVLVEVGGDRYLADVGNGAPFFAPIPLDRVVEVRQAGLAYRFRPGEAATDWIQERRLHGAWAPFCRYDLRPAADQEREAGYQGHHTPGQSWVIDRPRLVRCEENEIVSLTNDELVRFSAAGKHTERIRDPAAYAHLAAEVFRLPALPIAAALQARADLAGTTTSP